MIHNAACSACWILPSVKIARVAALNNCQVRESKMNCQYLFFLPWFARFIERQNLALRDVVKATELEDINSSCISTLNLSAETLFQVGQVSVS